MARDETAMLEMGLRIKELRESKGFKQQWIADQVGVSLRMFQFWQAGASKPEGENLIKLSEILGVTPTFILRGETPELLSDRKDQLTAIQEQLAAQQEQLLLLRAELAVRDAEALQQIESLRQTIQDSRPGQQ